MRNRTSGVYRAQPDILLLIHTGHTTGLSRLNLMISWEFLGADRGNRTLIFCLEGSGSTIELHPRYQEICVLPSEGRIAGDRQLMLRVLPSATFVFERSAASAQ